MLSADHPRYWLARLIVSTWAGADSIVVLMNPDSIAGHALLHDGPFGAWVLLALWAIALAGFIDVAGNDIGHVPGLRFLQNQRHIGFCLMASVLVLLAGVIVLHTRRASLAAFFFIPGFFAALVAWLDMFARHDARRKAMSCA